MPPGLRHLRHCVTRPNAHHSRSTAAGWLLELLDVLGSGPQQGRVRQCPAHHDNTPSLSIKEGEDGRALVYCHAGGSARAVMNALQLPMARLFEPASCPPAEYAKLFKLRIDFP